MHFINLGDGQIEKMCGLEQSRYTLSEVYFNAERGHLAATDGHGLVVANVTAYSGEVSGTIPNKALIAYRNEVRAVAKEYSYVKDPAASVRFYAGEHTVTIENTASGETRSFKRGDLKKSSMPNYEAVLPPAVEAQPDFIFDLGLLTRLAMAMGFAPGTGLKQQRVALWAARKADGTTDNTAAIFVKTLEEGPLGVLMPMRGSKDKSFVTTLAALDELILKRSEAMRLPQPDVAEEEEEGIEDVGPAKMLAASQGEEVIEPFAEPIAA